jgi:hypothetical protein
VFEQSNRDRVASADSDAFDARASQCHVSTAFVRALAGVVQQRGISPETLFGSETAAVYAEPAERSIPLSAFQSLFSRAICLTRDPALGLHCGLQASESSFGLMSPLVAHAPTLRHALALAAQFQPLLSDGVRIRLTEHMGVAQLRCDLDCDVARNRSSWSSWSRACYGPCRPSVARKAISVPSASPTRARRITTRTLWSVQAPSASDNRSLASNSRRKRWIDRTFIVTRSYTSSCWGKPSAAWSASGDLSAARSVCVPSSTAARSRSCLKWPRQRERWALVPAH